MKHIIFKALHGNAPKFLSDRLTFREARASRSSNKLLLNVPHTYCVTLGSQAFSVYATNLLNSVPYSLKSYPEVEEFKTGVKTHLIERYFG